MSEELAKLLKSNASIEAEIIPIEKPTSDEYEKAFAAKNLNNNGTLNNETIFLTANEENAPYLYTYFYK